MNEPRLVERLQLASESLKAQGKGHGVRSDAAREKAVLALL
jgi:hypothetical protein